MYIKRARRIIGQAVAALYRAAAYFATFDSSFGDYFDIGRRYGTTASQILL